MIDQAMKKRTGAVHSMVRFFLILAVMMPLSAGLCFAENETNKMVSLQMEEANSGAALRIVTDKPIGYRYTVYDSIDPVRVVIDFPGMDIDSVSNLSEVDLAPVQNVDVSSYDLTSGRLGRVEVVLSSAADYDVKIEGNEFVLSLTAKGAAADTSTTVGDVPKPAVEVVDTAPAVVADVPAAPVSAAPEMDDSTPATAVTDVTVGVKNMTLQADGHVGVYKFFSLGGPARLVVDVYGVKPQFKSRSFTLDDGFSKARVGVYKDKLRFVFDAPAKLPEYSVTSTGNDVVVTWGAMAPSVEKPLNSQVSSVKTGGPVTVEAVDFTVEDGFSVLRIKLNGQPEVIDPSQKGDVVGFGIHNATISRSLRRAIDASAFPSAIRLVTPYLVQVGSMQDVRFAVELKGPTTFTLDRDDNALVLKVDNVSFAEPQPASPEQIAVQVPEAAPAAPIDTATENMPVESIDPVVAAAPEIATAMETASEASMASANAAVLPINQPMGQQYSGQRISLVFDNADVRNILQLIAEVSELNILAGDGVDGTITLRLIDVPWDQALDLILETKDLGMVRQGNVARILPREAIRTMEESKYTAARTKEKLEDVVTEVIKVSYTDLKNITGPVKALLTERGSVTEDSRNKQLIISDIPKTVEAARELTKILDTPERQVLIEARIVEVNTTANLDLGVQWDIYHSQNPAGSENMSGSVSLGGSFVIPPFVQNQPAGLGSSFTWGQVGVDTTILDMRLSAVESSGNGRVVSNPRILTLNGESAKISQGTMIPYQTVSNNEIRTELVEAALSLEVTPVINPDNTVILAVKTSNSTPGTTVATGAGSAPQIDKKEAETKMLVKDGETMVIGGIYIEKEDFSENGVPFLMDIPLIGNLFKSTKSNKNRTELMIFITPRIVE
jgi:type IV pilus assembly protein PilQ